MDYKESVLERDKTIWIATVDQGNGPEEIWQRVDLEEDTPGYSSWEVFRSSFVGRILGFKIKFRSHIEELPSGASAYYFRKGMIATMPGGDQANCYVMGYVENDVLHKIWYRIPELIEWQVDKESQWNKDDVALIINQAGNTI